MRHRLLENEHIVQDLGLHAALCMTNDPSPTCQHLLKDLHCHRAGRDQGTVWNLSGYRNLQVSGHPEALCHQRQGSAGPESSPEHIGSCQMAPPAWRSGAGPEFERWVFEISNVG